MKDSKFVVFNFSEFVNKHVQIKENSLKTLYFSLKNFLSEVQYSALWEGYDKSYLINLVNGLSAIPIPSYIAKRVYDFIKLADIPIEYSLSTSFLSVLKVIGLSENDTVILLLDAKNSWRSAIDENYKIHSRLDKRLLFVNEGKLDYIVQSMCTGFQLSGMNVLMSDLVEAKDLMTRIAEMDTSVVFVTNEPEIEQLFVNDNVFIFNYKKKLYTKKPVNPFKKVITQVNKAIKEKFYLSPAEVENVTALTKMPEFVRDKCNELLDGLQHKQIAKDFLPTNYLKDNWDKVYLNDKVINYDECNEKLKRKERRYRNKLRQSKIVNE